MPADKPTSNRQRPRPRQLHRSHASWRGYLGFVFRPVTPVAEVATRKSRWMSADDGPGESAEILVLRTVTQRDWNGSVVPKSRRIPEQNDLTGGRAQRVVADDFLLDAIGQSFIRLELSETLQNLAYGRPEGSADQPVQILTPQRRVQMLDSREYS